MMLMIPPATANALNICQRLNPSIGISPSAHPSWLTERGFYIQLRKQNVRALPRADISGAGLVKP